jgi:hypothetical protein
LHWTRLMDGRGKWDYQNGVRPRMAVPPV